MKLHGNARLSVKGRELLVDRVENAGWSLTQAAEAAGVSDRTARKWLARYRADVHSPAIAAWLMTSVGAPCSAEGVPRGCPDRRGTSVTILAG
jgi:leucine-zipper of insertion element IS481